MTKIIQMENISKKELYAYLEDLIDNKFQKFTAKSQNEKLSIQEVAKELGVVELTVHNYIKRGILPASKIGRRVFISRKDLDSCLTKYKSLKYRR